MHKILGQVDIVGVPFTLGSSLVEGLTGLLVNPAKARNPAEFFDSLGHGFFILFRNAAYGIFHAFGQVLPVPLKIWHCKRRRFAPKYECHPLCCWLSCMLCCAQKCCNADMVRACAQAAGGAARGCAALTGDAEYSARFRAQPMTHRQRLLHGVQSAGVGLYEGAIGIIKEPLVGWQVAAA